MLTVKSQSIGPVVAFILKDCAMFYDALGTFVLFIDDLDLTSRDFVMVSIDLVISRSRVACYAI